MEKFYKGQLIRCKVTGVLTYGIFVKVNKDYTGLIHISEISKNFIRNIKDYAMVNDLIYCKIIDIDEKNKRLKLSIKNIDYKSRENITKNIESKNGFKPLKENLNNWIKQKLEEYKQ